MMADVNKLWHFLAKGLDTAGSSLRRGPAAAAGEAPAWSRDMLQGSDADATCWRIERCVQLCYLSRFRNRLLELDPVNTYDAALPSPEERTSISVKSGSLQAREVGAGRFSPACRIRGWLAVDMENGSAWFRSESDKLPILGGVVELAPGLRILLEGEGQGLFFVDAVRRPRLDVLETLALIPDTTVWLPAYADHAGYHRPDLSLAAYVMNQFERSLL